jgi:GNAT superfamily N-acetyltransferase
MEIKQAKSTDLVEVLYLLKVCIGDMNAKGLMHWNSAFPGNEQIRKDLLDGSIYLAKDRGVCKGMVTLNDIEPEEYRELKFPENDTKPLYLNRLAVHPKWHGRGIASIMVDFAQKMAREKGYTCIRLDIFQSAEDARQLCKKLSFKEIGSFQANYQRIPFICYEKQV